MSTKIHSVDNESTAPVAYMGTQFTVPTGWAAWGFPPTASKDFGWTVERAVGKQALSTQAGVFYIWDDGHWAIRYKKAGSADEKVLIQLHGPWDPEIVLKVGNDGMPTAIQR